MSAVVFFIWEKICCLSEGGRGRDQNACTGLKEDVWGEEVCRQVFVRWGRRSFEEAVDGAV